EKYLTGHTSLVAYNSENWYFDSSYSRHITGNRSFPTDYHEISNRCVTSGDGKKDQILGVGNLYVQRFPNLKNMLLVEGLEANLISISQICDD
ncbi:hypothetical protein TorRG33x02_035080, partial [Trema orientale]